MQTFEISSGTTHMGAASSWPHDMLIEVMKLMDVALLTDHTVLGT